MKRVIRKIIVIDEEKCNGCGLCAAACHEGAIGMVNGKARLLREDYCDGLGDCLPACPAGAISFEEREAAPYDAAAVAAAKAGAAHTHPAGGCPSAAARTLRPASAPAGETRMESQLVNWPVQIQLLPCARRTCRVRTCSSPRTARRSPMPTCTRTSCAGA